MKRLVHRLTRRLPRLVLRCACGRLIELTRRESGTVTVFADAVEVDSKHNESVVESR